MLAICDQFVLAVEPIYKQLHAWARRILAKRYQTSPPADGKIPAHWLPKRWAQNWPQLVSGIDMDAPFRGKPREFIPRQAEQLYGSLGFPDCPLLLGEIGSLSSRTRYQGITAPGARPESLCDAATKTHVNDDPAQYYDYAIGTVIKYQLHDHIARQILRQDPHECDYYGNKQVGECLRAILAMGATRDWNTLLREATGQTLSARAGTADFEPLLQWLQDQNKGERIGWS